MFGYKSKRINGEIAAVDLGSNSFHLVVARVEQGQLVIIDKLREMIRLAEGLDEETGISPEAQQRALDCLQRFGQRLSHLDGSQIQAVGTNTLRIAANAEWFLEQAEQALGHSIGVISGYEEARLIYSGVAHSISESDSQRLVIDIGGGSTEIIIGKNLKPLYMESLFVGSSSISNRFFGKEHISDKHFKKAETAVLIELEPFITKYRDLGWDEVVGSSGTIRATSSVLMENGWSDGRITLSGLEKIKQAILDVETVNLPGLSEGRVPVFPGGVAVLLALFKALGIDSMNVSSGAIREGMLYELIGRQIDHDIREEIVRHMIGRYNIDMEHQKKVAATSLLLFNQVSGILELDESDEDLLSWAAALHEIGLIVSHQQYHKHGAYILEHMDLAGFSRQEQQRLALLVRCHRGSMPKSLFKTLTKKWSNRLLYMVVLLRLAVILHRSRNLEPLPEVKLTFVDGDFNLFFLQGWLESHPLTYADLQAEAVTLSNRGVQLDFA